MENQLESSCQGNILQFPRHHWGQIFLTSTIDAYEGQDIMVINVTNTFIQTKIRPKKDGEERIIMKITGLIVDMLLELDSQTYSNNVVFDNIYIFNLHCYVERNIWNSYTILIILQEILWILGKYWIIVQYLGYMCLYQDKIWQETHSEIPCGQHHVQSFEL